jgi:Glycosyltransferase 61
VKPPVSLQDLEVLNLDDFQLPAPGSAPEGLIELHDGLLFPGAHGVFDRLGRPIPESFLRRGPGASEYPYGEPQAQEVPGASGLDWGGEILFVPYARFEIFGHLLTEAAAHLSLLLDPEVQLLATTAAQATVVLAADSDQAIEPVRSLLGLEPHRIRSTRSLLRPLFCPRVLIPRPSMINRCAVERRHFLAVQRLLDRRHHLAGASAGKGGLGGQIAADPGQARLYLGRSRLPPECRRVAGEDLLEAELRRRGWSVVYPETLPLSEQLRLLAEAPVIAGCIGSAMHLLMYFGEGFAGRPLIGLGPIDRRLNRNFVYQFLQQRLDYRQISCLDRDPECPKRAHGVHVQDLRLAVAAPRLAEAIEALAEAMVADPAGGSGGSQPLPD